MNKVINLDKVKEDKLQERMEDVLEVLGNLNTLSGYNRVEAKAAIEYTLERIKDALFNYFDGMYDEAEPNVAAHNLNIMMDELIDVAECNAVVVRD